MIDRYELDKQLAKSICSGDRVAFDRFFREYFPRLYRFVLGRVSGDVDLARDLVQQAMIKSVRAISGYRGEAALFTWLCQLCRSEISAHHRKQARRGRVVVSIEDPGYGGQAAAVADDSNQQPAARIERSDRLRSVHELLDSLPGAYAEVLELKYVEGCSVAEIAQRLDTSGAAVQSMLARARDAFRKAAAAAGLTLEMEI